MKKLLILIAMVGFMAGCHTNRENNANTGGTSSGTYQTSTNYNSNTGTGNQ
ncbi:MAG TPA: hypothetical protein VFB72_19570 [Verrucomicrobiae bacterium]|nr:hypothetical protein [Verrucomicrobiae bacterium]